MADIATIAFYFGVITYSVAATLFFMELLRKDGDGARSPWAPRLLALGGVLHATHVLTASLLSHVCPIDSLHFALSFSALIAVGAYLALRERLRLSALGAFIAPIALTFLVGAQFVGQSSEAALGVSRTLLMFHIAANVLGIGLFLIAGAAGSVYLLQEHRLRTKKRVAHRGSRLPPLDSLDTTTHRLLLAGFPLLTFGVVTGAVFSRQLTNPGGAESLRSLLGYATWILLAAVLVLRKTAGFSGRKAAYGTIAGVVCMLLVLLMYVVRSGGGGNL
ncbi:MAG TPA: cytochrome c biogenesis protein CcsA [Polyangiaceae bacterium]|nr:cytochrome c biogenesis protein CcsA [Polyangiaceae bacterium]